MSINKKSSLQKVKSFAGDVAGKIRDFFTPERKEAIKQGGTAFFETTETMLDILAHPRRTYRQAPRLGKLAIVTGIAVLSHFGLLKLNEQEQENKAKDILRSHILTIDGTSQEKDVLLENARLAKRNFKAYIPTLTEKQADSLLAQHHLASAMANTIAYKEMMDVVLFLKETPPDQTPSEWLVLRDSLDVMTSRAEAFGGAALHELEEFSKIAKAYVAPEFYVEDGLPVVHMGRNNPVLTSGYELGQQIIDLAENMIEITKVGYNDFTEWRHNRALKKNLKQELK